MSGTIPVAFYAPLKSPNHPSPSGDRTMARLLLKALRTAGFAPELASELRTLDLAGDAGVQAAIRVRSQAEAQRLISAFRSRPAEERPRLWFTYHVYYKAPDWIGPHVSDALAIPYAVAEGSRAGQRASGPWALGHGGAEAALDRADALFVMTAKDRVALERDRRPGQRLIDLPPFLDEEEWFAQPPLDGEGRARERAGWGDCASAHRAAPGHELAFGDSPHPGLRPTLPLQRRAAGARLLTVAMMRRGDKLASYRILAEALRQLHDRPWSLTVVGDGEARAEVEALFAPFRERVAFEGQVGSRARLADLYREADLFLWPAVNEAYGMVLLEAQALGCPVVAGAYGGVASVVQDGRTGLLASPGDAAAFAAAVRGLLDDPDRIASLSRTAARFVREERSLAMAASRLRAGLEPLLAGGTV